MVTIPDDAGSRVGRQPQGRKYQPILVFIEFVNLLSDPEYLQLLAFADGGDELGVVGGDVDRAGVVDGDHGLFVAVGVEVELGESIGAQLLTTIKDAA